VLTQTEIVTLTIQVDINVELIEFMYVSYFFNSINFLIAINSLTS